MTFVEALGGHNGETIMEKLGGHNGDMLHKVMENKEIVIEETEPTPEPIVTKYTVTYDANGGTGTIESVEVTAGESMNVSDGTGLTAPEGKQFVGWAKSAVAQSATVTSPFTPDKDTTLYAVWTDVTPEPGE